MASGVRALETREVLPASDVVRLLAEATDNNPFATNSRGRSQLESVAPGHPHRLG